VNARKLSYAQEREPTVIVRDAGGTTLRPPPVSRRRQRVQTLPGLGERSDENRASLLPVSEEDMSAVDELLAESLDGFYLPAD